MRTPQILGRRLLQVAALGALSSSFGCSDNDEIAPPDGSGGFIEAGNPDEGGAPSEAGAAGADNAGATSGEAGAPGGLGGGVATGGAAEMGGASDVSSLPSCTSGGGALSCGPSSDSCCASLEIPGGTFYRSFDGVTADYDDQSFPASVTGFSLDKYEVTVGRFRRFVSAVVGGWRPDLGSGTRTDLNLGKGLVNAGPDGGYDPGWDSTWNSELAAGASGWNTNLACVAAPTWTSKAGKNEQLPITCVNWYEAFAFCVWDEGRLPTEAEWNDAASGGDEQRVFPWSSPATSQIIDCAHANYFGAPGPDFCTSPGVGAVSPVGSESPAGDGRWGQADLAGNVYEWVRDWYAPYTPECPDCVYIADAPNHVMRGGGFGNAAPDLLGSSRAANAAGARSGSLGVRCARGL